MITISTTAFNFGPVNTGSTVSHIVVVTNTGTVPAKINLIQGNDLLNPDHQNFDISLETFVVAKNSTYSFNVSYSPITAVLNSSIIQVFVDDAVTPAFVITLDGNGVAVPIIDTQQIVNFPKTYASEVHEETFPIQNNGTATLVITSFAIDLGAEDYKLVSLVPTTILAGQSASITVRYTPKPDVAYLITGNRTRIGRISITSNSLPSPRTIDLVGITGVRDGAWLTFNLSTLVPSYLIDGAKQIENMVSVVKSTLTVATTLAKGFQATLVSVSNPLSIPLIGLKKFVDDQFNDIRNTGVYLLPVMPLSFYNDPKANSDSQFESMVAATGGGSAMFKQRIIDSFDDIYDGNRPQFSDSATVGAVVIAIDSGNLQDVIKGWRQIKGVFNNIDWKSEVIPPTNIKAAGGSNVVNLSWALPDLFSFDLSFGLSASNAGLSIGSVSQVGQLVKKKFKINPLDFIEKFEIYSSEIPNNLIVADADIPPEEIVDPRVPIKKGDVYSLVFNTDTPQKIKMTPNYVLATTLIKTAESLYISNFDSKSSDLVKSSILYQFIDSGKTNEKTYYYSIRTVMKSGDTSRLSSEVFATPEAKVNTVSTNGLKACANLKLDTMGPARTLWTLISPTIISVKQKDTTQQVSSFAIAITAPGISVDTLKLYNFSKAMRMATGRDLVDGSKRTMDVTGITEDNFDSINSADSADLAQRKKLFLNDYANKTLLASGSEAKMKKTNDANRQNKEVLNIVIRDINHKGYTLGDRVVITYDAALNPPVYRCSLKQREFDSVKCLSGANNGICNAYSNKMCIYHGGNKCLNVGFTKTVNDNLEFENTPNTKLFKFGPCQSGANRGIVNDFDKQFTNSPNRAILPVHGVCAGYTALDDVKNAVGQFPDWKKINTGGAAYMFPQIDEFVKTMQDFVDKQLGSIQATNETVSQFLDLLVKKTESFQQTLDALDRIVRVIEADYSGAGFNVLNIAPEPGGIKRIKKRVVEATGGPRSSIDGYTAGIVILYGDDAITAQFISKLFGASE